MSTSKYYNFLNSATDKATSQQDVGASSIGAHRQAATSPESIATSPSNSSSSLNQFNSSTPTSTVSSSTAYSSSSSASSSSSSMASATNLMATTITAPTRKMALRLLTTTANNNTNSNNNNSFSHNTCDLQRQSSITPTRQLNNHHHHSQLTHSYTLHSLEPRPLKPFRSRSAYIEAMKEDLSEWLNRLYIDLELNADSFFSQLETGAIICRHANNVTQMGRNSMLEQAANESGGSSSNDDSLETSLHQNASLSSPSPECDQQQPKHLLAINSFVDQLQHPHHYHHDIGHQSLNHRHRHSTTNSSISSLATNSSSASRQRLSLTGSSVISPRQDRHIDWFRVNIVPYKADAQPGTFFARDNICQFIMWCRSIHVRECLLFETDDLVARKNEKSFILCLLEVARIGFKVGMPTPLIIQLEQEIDREIENDAKLQNALGAVNEKQLDSSHADKEISDDIQTASHNEDDHNNNGLKAANDNKQAYECVSQELGEEQDYGPKPQVITNDLLSLHEKVVQLLCQCTCPTQFPMVRIGDGKYKVGDKLVIFVRILRRHIMVRVGGGWQELSEFLRQKDPCRAKHHHCPLNSGAAAYGASGQQHEHFATATTPPTLTANLANATTTTTRIPTLTNGSSASRSRLLGSNGQLTKSYHQRNGGQKLISGSLSMSWLPHNS